MIVSPFFINFTPQKLYRIWMKKVPCISNTFPVNVRGWKLEVDFGAWNLSYRGWKNKEKTVFLLLVDLEICEAEIGKILFQQDQSATIYSPRLDDSIFICSLGNSSVRNSNSNIV